MAVQYDLFGNPIQEHEVTAGSNEVCLYAPGSGKKIKCFPRQVAVSAMQKYIRRGEWRKAVVFGLAVAQNDPYYFWRRMRIIAIEDLLNPQLFSVFYGMQREYQMLCGEKKPCVNWDANRLAVAAIILAAEAKKDRRADEMLELLFYLGEDRIKGKAKEEIDDWFKVDEFVLDMHTGKYAVDRSNRFWYEVSSQTENRTEEYEEWREWFDKLAEEHGYWDKKEGDE